MDLVDKATKDFFKAEKIMDKLMELTARDPHEKDEWEYMWALGEDHVSLDEREWLYFRLFGVKIDR